MTPQLYLFTKSIRSFFAHHHLVMFVAAVGLLLSYAAYSLYEVVITPAVSDVPRSQIDVFDEDTIKKINTLQDSGSLLGAELTLPSPRPNPFVE